MTDKTGNIYRDTYIGHQGQPASVSGSDYVGLHQEKRNGRTSMGKGKAANQPESVGEIIESLEASVEALKRFNDSKHEPEFLIAHLLMETAQLWLEKWGNRND